MEFAGELIDNSQLWELTVLRFHSSFAACCKAEDKWKKKKFIPPASDMNGEQCRDASSHTHPRLLGL